MNSVAEGPDERLSVIQQEAVLTRPKNYSLGGKLPQVKQMPMQDSIEVVGTSRPKNERENLENFYTGALATEVNRSHGGARGLSTHAVSNSLTLRRESLRLEKTLMLRQKITGLEEQLKIAVLQNQGLKAQNDELQYGCNLRQVRIEDLADEMLDRDNIIKSLKQ